MLLFLHSSFSLSSKQSIHTSVSTLLSHSLISNTSSFSYSLSFANSPLSLLGVLVHHVRLGQRPLLRRDVQLRARAVASAPGRTGRGLPQASARSASASGNTRRWRTPSGPCHTYDTIPPQAGTTPSLLVLLECFRPGSRLACNLPVPA